MTRIFTGDYSTGDFTQWNQVTNKSYADVTKGGPYRYPARSLYPLQLQSEGDGGYCARFEVRTGDVPGFGGGERSETSGGTPTFAATGTTRWYAFSVKFDSTYPTNQRSLGWCTVMQWHDSPNGATSPVIHFGWPLASEPGTAGGYPGFRDGYWYLMQNPQSPRGTFLGAKPLLELPFNLGQWHDMKLCINWQQDTTGTVQVWRNGVRQTFLGPGGTTFTGQTVVPAGVGGGNSVDGVRVQQGLYRDNGQVPTGIVYHKGFRMADSEDSL